MVYVKRVVNISAFLLGLILLLLFISYLFVPKNNMEKYGMEEVQANGILGEKKDSIDLVVLGDSESYSSISPMQIWRDAGYTAYVCGSSGQTLDYSYLMLKRAFKNQSPKLVILESNAIYREISESKVVISHLENYFSIFQYHDRWKTIGWNDLTGKVDYTWTDDFKGYKQSSAVKAASGKNYMKETKKIELIPDSCVQYVKQIKELCDIHGAKFLLLRTPSSKNWNYAKYNGIKKLADEIVCEQLDLNLMNDQIGIDWSIDTRDKGDHLNNSGAVKVTSFIASYLQKTKLFQDYRDDQEYASWNESLKRYEKVVSEKL